MASLLKWAIRLPASKWKLREDWDEDVYLAKQKRVKNLLGVVTAAEKADKFVHKKSLLCDDFLQYVQKREMGKSGYKSEAARSSSG